MTLTLIFPWLVADGEPSRECATGLPDRRGCAARWRSRAQGHVAEVFRNLRRALRTRQAVARSARHQSVSGSSRGPGRLTQLDAIPCVRCRSDCLPTRCHLFCAAIVLTRILYSYQACCYR